MSTLFLNDPKIEQLGEKHGPAAVSVSVALFAEAMRQERGGEAEVTYRTVGHDSFTDAATAAAVISDAEKVGFLQVEGVDDRSARVVFPAWSRHQAAFRKAVSRAKQKSSSNAGLRVDVTDGHKKSLTGQDNTRQEKTDTTPTPSVAGKPPTPEEAPLSHLLADLVASNDPDGKRPRVTRRWGNAEERMLRIDGRDPAQAERLIRWALADSFWAGVIQSMPKLRDKYGQLHQRMMAERTGRQPRAQAGHDRAKELTERAKRLREQETASDGS